MKKKIHCFWILNTFFIVMEEHILHNKGKAGNYILIYTVFRYYSPVIIWIFYSWIVKWCSFVNYLVLLLEKSCLACLVCTFLVSFFLCLITPRHERSHFVSVSKMHVIVTSGTLKYCKITNTVLASRHRTDRVTLLSVSRLQPVNSICLTSYINMLHSLHSYE